MSVQGDQQPAGRVFISYSRKDADFVEELAGSLRERRYLVDFDLGGDALKIDLGIAPTDQWQARLMDLIAAADAVVFVVSPESAASAVCDWEIEQSQRMGKRLVPVLWRSIDFSRATPRLSALNVAIAFDVDFSRGLAALIQVIDNDVEWLREQSRLTVLAKRWESSDRPNSQLLRSGEIAAVESWVSRRPASSPPPSALILDFVSASKQFETGERTRLRTTTGRAYVEPTSRAVAEGRYDEAVRLAAAGALAADDLDFALVPQLWDAVAPAIVQSRLICALTAGASEQYEDAHFSSLELLQDDTAVFASFANKPATLWDVKTGSIRHSLGPIGRVGLGVLFPSNDFVVTGRETEPLKVWSAQTGELVRQLQEELRPEAVDETAGVIWTLRGGVSINTGSATTTLRSSDHTPDLLAITPDKRCLVTGDSHPKGDGSNIIVWNADTGEPIYRLTWETNTDENLRIRRHLNKIVQLEVSPQSDRLLVLRESEDWVQSRAEEHGDDKYAVEIWNLATGEPDVLLIGLKAHANSACFSDDGALVAATSDGGGAMIWETATGQPVSNYLQSTLDHHPSGHQIAFHPSGLAVASPTTNGVVTTWHAASGRALRHDRHLRVGRDFQLQMRSQVRSVRFSRNGRRLLTGGSDATVKVWDAHFSMETARFDGHSGAVSSVAFSPEGALLATSADDGMARVFEIASGRCVAELRIRHHASAYCWFSTDGSRLHALSDDGESHRPWNTEGDVSLQSWHVHSWQDAETIEGKGWLRSFHELTSTFSSEEVQQEAARLLSAGGHLDPVLPLKDDTAFLRPVRFQRGNRIFEINTEAQGTKVLDADASSELRFFPRYPFYYSSAPVDPDVQRILLDDDGAVWIAGIADGRLLHRLEYPGIRVTDAAFSPDGATVAVGLADGTARIVDITRTGALLGDRAAILCAATAAGIGTFSDEERSNLLLLQAPANIEQAISDRLTDTQRIEATRVRQALIRPLSPTCYTPPSETSVPDNQAWSPAIESLRRQAVKSGVESFYRYAKAEHPRGRPIYEAVANDITIAALRHFASKNIGRMHQVPVVERPSRFGLNDSPVSAAVESALEAVSDLHATDGNAIGMHGGGDPDRLSIWERDTQPVWTIQNKRFPKIHRFDVEPVAKAYLTLPYRSNAFELILVRALIACEMYAYGDEIYNEDAKFLRDMGLEPKSALNQNPWPGILLGLVPAIFVLLAAGVAVSWAMQLEWLGPWANWVGFSVGVLGGILAAGLPGLVTSETRRNAENRRKTLGLMSAMVTTYMEVPESAPLVAKQLIEKVDTAARLGVVWSPVLSEILDDISRRKAD